LLVTQRLSESPSAPRSTIPACSSEWRVSWLSFLIIGVLLAAYEVYLQRIKPAPPDEASPASGLASAKPRQKSSNSPAS
jgi:hypothetical protein